jgi:hypothetical protein
VAPRLAVLLFAVLAKKKKRTGRLEGGKRGRFE